MKPIRHLELFITENCNLKCEYCFASGMEKKNISDELARKAVDFLFENSKGESFVILSFWGGEPFLRFTMIKKLVMYSLEVAKKEKREIRFSIPTNATLLDEEILDFVQEYKISISLSIDGNEFSQSFRKTVDGKSSFPVIIEKLELIRQKSLNHSLFIRKTVSPSTVGNLYEDIIFFMDQGFKHIAFSPVMEEKWSSKDFQIFEEEQLRLADLWIKELKSRNDVTFQIWDEMFSIRTLYKKGDLTQKKRFFCGAGRSTFAVDIYGDIYPCHRFVFYDKSMRKQRLGSLEQGITEKKLYESYDNIDDEKLLKRTKHCQGCKYFDRCLLFCPATNYALTNDIYKNDEKLCKFLEITEHVMDYIEGKIGREAYFKEHLDRSLMRIYQYNPLSRFGFSFWEQLKEEDLNKITQKSLEILDKIKKQQF
jgi:uncharacterized protein